MENAVEALKMAFAMLVLVLALSVSIMSFSAARQTADFVLQSADPTATYEYNELCLILLEVYRCSRKLFLS